MPIRVTVWNEFRHERNSETVKAVYPQGIHGAIASFLGVHDDIVVRTATLDEKDCGLGGDVLNGIACKLGVSAAMCLAAFGYSGIRTFLGQLGGMYVVDNTDVLIWWGHMAHDDVPDEVAKKVQEAVLRGMGFIALHSAHLSKPFRLLMGTSCTLRWRDNDRERLWVAAPSHPIAEGLPPYIELAHEEMYGEFFDIPKPDETVLIGWFQGGEVFRSGAVWNRGYGKVFYFQPGHEEYPTYHDPNVQRILLNAVRWAAPKTRRDELSCPCTRPVEKKQ